MRKMITPKKFQSTKTSEIEISENGEGKVINGFNDTFFEWRFNHNERILEWKEHYEKHWHEWGRDIEERNALYEYVAIWIVEDEIFGDDK